MGWVKAISLFLAGVLVIGIICAGLGWVLQHYDIDKSGVLVQLMAVFSGMVWGQSQYAVGLG